MTYIFITLLCMLCLAIFAGIMMSIDISNKIFNNSVLYDIKVSLDDYSIIGISSVIIIIAIIWPILIALIFPIAVAAIIKIVSVFMSFICRNK